MAIIDRVKGILLEPKNEWTKIAAEPATAQSLYTGWILILAALGPIALTIRTVGAGLGIAIASYVIALVVVYVVALIADMLAPSFGGSKDLDGSLKLVAYSMTAAWVGGLFHVVPLVGWLIGLAASVYSIYLFYVGAPIMKKCAPDKAVFFTVAVVLCTLVLQILLGSVLMAMMFGGAMMGTMMPGM